jgi:hypothetical protein
MPVARKNKPIGRNSSLTWYPHAGKTAPGRDISIPDKKKTDNPARADLASDLGGVGTFRFYFTLISHSEISYTFQFSG